MSLFADYQKERYGWETIEDYDSFLSYSIRPPFLRIEELYVTPLRRNQDLATKLADQAAEVAKEKGLTHLWAQVGVGSQVATDSIKVILAYGFRIAGADQGVVYFTKELKGGPDGERS